MCSSVPQQEGHSLLGIAVCITICALWIAKSEELTACAG